MMRTAIKKAAAPTAARKNKLQNEHYQKVKPLSKEKIGELLFYLQTLPEKERQEQWPVFEFELRQYADRRMVSG